MSSIVIANLHFSGSDLLFDSETFLDELSESDVSSINGGLTPFVASVALSFAIGKAIWEK